MQFSRRVCLAVFSAFLGGCCCPDAPRAAPPATPPTATTKKVETAPVARKPIQTEEERRIRAVLTKKRLKGLHWEEQNLDQTVAYLRTVTGLNFFITPKVREEKFEEVVINAQLDDVSVATILSVVLTEPFGMRWDVRDGVVWIHSPEEFAGLEHLRYYDVRDLVGKDVEDGFPTVDDLAIELQRNVMPEYWEKDGVTMEGRNGILIVRAARGALAMVGRHLGIIRGKAAPVVAKAQEGNDPWKPVRAPKADATSATRVSLSVADQFLTEVIKTLQIQTGRNLMIDPRIASDLSATRIVGMKLENAPLTTAMTMLAAAAGEDCLWVRKGNVQVLTRKELLTR